MRLLLATTPLLLLAACQVSKSDNEVSVSYDQNTAEEAVADAANTAGAIARDIGNDVEQTADKVQQKADEVQADDQPASSATNAN